jgi:hypothetical protein
MVMSLPFHDASPGLMAMMDKILAQSQAAGAAPEIPAGEGLQNVPVGTMLAQIEQATKVMAAVHKGQHTAQAEEFQLIVDLFRENPEDFWRYNKEDQNYWTREKLWQAITDYDLVPVSDPNVPSHIHRVAKGVALVQLTTNPVIGPRLDPDELTSRVLRAMREDPKGLQIKLQPQAAPPDPKMIKAQADLVTAQNKSTESAANAQLTQAKVEQLPLETQNEADKIKAQRDVAAADLQREHLIHGADMLKAAHAASLDQAEHGHNVQQAGADQQLNTLKTLHDISQDHHQRQMDRAGHALDVYEATKPEPKPKPKAKP